MHGFDTTDDVLDIFVEPDGTWHWTDETELAFWVDHGAYKEADREHFFATAETVEKLIEAGSAPFDDEWVDWLPPAAPRMPSLPDGWHQVEGWDIALSSGRRYDAWRAGTTSRRSPTPGARSSARTVLRPPAALSLRQALKSVEYRRRPHVRQAKRTPMSLTGRPAEEPLRIRSLPWSVDIDGSRREEVDSAKITDYAEAPDDRLVLALEGRDQKGPRDALRPLRGLRVLGLHAHGRRRPAC